MHSYSKMRRSKKNLASQHGKGLFSACTSTDCVAERKDKVKPIIEPEPEPEHKPKPESPIEDKGAIIIKALIEGARIDTKTAQNLRASSSQLRKSIPILNKKDKKEYEAYTFKIHELIEQSQNAYKEFMKGKKIVFQGYRQPTYTFMIAFKETKKLAFNKKYFIKFEHNYNQQLHVFKIYFNYEIFIDLKYDNSNKIDSIYLYNYNPYYDEPVNNKTFIVFGILLNIKKVIESSKPEILKKKYCEDHLLNLVINKNTYIIFRKFYMNPRWISVISNNIILNSNRKVDTLTNENKIRTILNITNHYLASFDITFTIEDTVYKNKYIITFKNTNNNINGTIVKISNYDKNNNTELLYDYILKPRPETVDEYDIDYNFHIPQRELLFGMKLDEFMIFIGIFLQLDKLFKIALTNTKYDYEELYNKINIIFGYIYNHFKQITTNRDFLLDYFTDYKSLLNLSPPKKPALPSMPPTPKGSPDRAAERVAQEADATGGALEKSFKKMDKTVVLKDGRKRCIYSGSKNKQYVKIKGELVPLKGLVTRFMINVHTMESS
jgi:hypothetical protein